jgi:hypothetical protein
MAHMPYPYTVTVPGLVSAIRQLRSVFPAQVTADTLKKWGIAPNNETYVINVLKFVGILDDDGRKVAGAAKVFVQHDEDEFARQFSGLVKAAYAALFEHFGDGAWSLSHERLISFFRAEDHTSATVGNRQAKTFEVLAGLAGHGPPPAEPRASPAPRRRKAESKTGNAAKSTDPPQSVGTTVSGPTDRNPANGEMSLTVRIEVNLPVSDDQAVYDKIFKSIRTNLLNG